MLKVKPQYLHKDFRKRGKAEFVVPKDAAIRIEELLARGASADPVGDNSDRTPLQRVAANASGLWQVSNNDWKRAATALLNGGANINARTLSGETALNIVAEDAVRNQNAMTKDLYAPILAFLVQHGADPQIKDIQGRTVTDILQAVHNADVRQQLMSAISKMK